MPEEATTFSMPDWCMEMTEHIYYDKKRDWNKIVERAMEQDFSWKNSAKQYETLYKELIGE